MSIAAAAPVATASLALRSVYAANTAAVAPVQQAAAPAQAHRGLDVTITQPMAEIVLQAAATASAHAATYDCRVTGATETVRNFDRVAMVKEGFEHMRTLFEMANGGEKTSAFTMVDARV